MLRLAMGAALAGIAAIGATGTAAWYTMQAKATLTANVASISAPSDKIGIGAWDPTYGTVTGSSTGTVATFTDSNTVLTDVMSGTVAASGSGATATVGMNRTDDGINFAKPHLKDDGTGIAALNSDVTGVALAAQDVSVNPYFVAAGSNSAAHTANGATAIANATNYSWFGVVNPSSPKKVRAFARFGFFLYNLSTESITISLSDSTFSIGGTHTVDAAKMSLAYVGGASSATVADYALTNQFAVTTESSQTDTTPINMPTNAGLTLAASTDTNADGIIELGTDTVSASYYVITIWVDGSVAGFDNSSYQSGTYGVNLVFAAV